MNSIEWPSLLKAVFICSVPFCSNVELINISNKNLLNTFVGCQTGKSVDIPKMVTVCRPIGMFIWNLSVSDLLVVLIACLLNQPYVLRWESILQWYFECILFHSNCSPVERTKTFFEHIFTVFRIFPSYAIQRPQISFRFQDLWRWCCIARNLVIYPRLFWFSKNYSIDLIRIFQLFKCQRCKR